MEHTNTKKIIKVCLIKVVNSYSPENVGDMSCTTTRYPGVPTPDRPIDKIEKMTLKSLLHPARYVPNKHNEYRALAKSIKSI